ncbi:MAG: hypothetical protein DSY88_06955 [Candidatus Poseidoniales archaeon]|nr:MAG: hypothetical protein DSY88_06955 [Candidatus Poseidoniales archaeon]
MGDWMVPESRTQPVLRGADLRTEMEQAEPGEGELCAWWLTQASWLIKFHDGATVLIDPWWRDLEAGDMWGKLLGEFPLEPEEHPEPDLICCTHWHDDHICPVSIPRLAAAFPETPIVIPNRSLAMVLEWGVPKSQLVTMKGDDEVTFIGDGGRMLTLHAIPAAHEELDVTEEGSNYLGFLVSSGDCTVLHMGDSQPYPGWHERIVSTSADLSGGLDLALLCINGNDNLRHDEAVDLALACRPRLVMPMHYGMDPGNTVDPAIFVDEMTARGDGIRHVVPEVGEQVILS